ncbi:MAG: benzoyl-CoA reductase subunit D [Myxococcota bacterium]
MTDSIHLTAGIDAGSSSIKVAIVRSSAGERAEILTTAIQRIRRRNVGDVARATYEQACVQAGVDPSTFDYVASTGDGDAIHFGTGHFYGMTTHARGALVLDPSARSALDIGALHARAIKLDERGRVLAHRMTSQCASGSGQFVENIARYLGVPLEDVGTLSLQASRPEEVSSICAVLAETDVINMVSRGITTPDILKGIHLSIAGRLARLLRAIGSEGVVLLTGGLAKDQGLVAALNEALASDSGKKGAKAPPLEVRTHELAPLAGAIGAAALGAFRCEQLKRSGRWDSLRPAAGA